MLVHSAVRYVRVVLKSENLRVRTTTTTTYGAVNTTRNGITTSLRHGTQLQRITSGTQRRETCQALQWECTDARLSLKNPSEFDCCRHRPLHAARPDCMPTVAEADSARGDVISTPDGAAVAICTRSLVKRHHLSRCQ